MGNKSKQLRSLGSLGWLRSLVSSICYRNPPPMQRNMWCGIQVSDPEDLARYREVRSWSRFIHGWVLYVWYIHMELTGWTLGSFGLMDLLIVWSNLRWLLEPVSSHINHYCRFGDDWSWGTIQVDLPVHPGDPRLFHQSLEAAQLGLVVTTAAISSNEARLSAVKTHQ